MSKAAELLKQFNEGTNIEEATDDQRKAETSVRNVISNMDKIEKEITKVSKLKPSEIEDHFILDVKGKPVRPLDFIKAFNKFRATYPGLVGR